MLATLIVAKKKSSRRKRFRPYIKGAIEQFLDLGTLASKTLVSDVVDDSVTEKAWLSSVKLIWTLKQFTPALTTGPVLVGVAHSDYTDSEIEAVIEQNTNWDQGDLIAQEIGRRKVRIVGTFSTPSAAVQNVTLNDGKPITTKCGWQLFTGDSLRYWAYNKGAGALATTAPDLIVSGHANLWPN